EGLPGKVWEGLMRTYLCAPLAQGRLKLVECLVVCLDHIQLCSRECGRRRGRRMQRERPGLRIRCERPPGCGRSERLDEVAPSHTHSLGSARSSTIRLQIEYAVPANSAVGRTSRSGPTQLTILITGGYPITSRPHASGERAPRRRIGRPKFHAVKLAGLGISRDWLQFV